MTPRAKELAATILQIIAEGNLGTDATGHFAKLEDIINEIGNKQDTLDVIKGFLLPMQYIRTINDKFEEIHNNKLEYKAYQITQLGRTYLRTHSHPGSFSDESTRQFLKSTPSSKSLNEPLFKRLEQLISKADDVLATHKPNPPGMIGFSTLDPATTQAWKASSENIIKSLCGEESSYYKNFVKETNGGEYTHSVKSGKGILQALKDDIDAGLYGSFEHAAPSYEVSNATINSDSVNLKISESVYIHIKQYLDSEDYFHAVEEAYKVVREKLREITGKEAATDVFNMNAESAKYHEQIFGQKAAPGSPQYDFYRGVGYLNLAIQFLRNEKSHSLATSVKKDLAIHYISLASLAYDLISRSEPR